MKKQRRTLVGRTLSRIRDLWKRRREDRRRTFLFEPLESRQLLAGDTYLGEGEGTAPTVVNVGPKIVLAGSPLWVSLDGTDAEGGQLTYTAVSSNPSLIPNPTVAPQSNKSLVFQVQGFGEMRYVLFDHLVPNVTARIKQLVASGFYDNQVITTDAVQGSPTATTFTGSAALSSVTNAYLGRRVVFTSGALNGQSGLVTAYNGTTKQFTFAAGTFTGASVAGDTFQVKNEIDFIRVLNDFVIQAGDPSNQGNGGSGVDFDDQFHVDLQHNRSGLLSMAKSGDDTNDSQFFITEERNEAQYITLTGSPTGGSFTLTYLDQSTGPIAFNNSGNFPNMAAAIQTALGNLSRIGAGNVTVTHDPVIDDKDTPSTADDVITENRRWRVDFTNALGHQQVINLTGNASGLTGGTSPAINITPQTSARFLDFNHSIFGVLTQGEAVRDAISNVAVVASPSFNGEVSKPTSPVIITNIDVIDDLENSALLLKPNAGQSGEADITVTVTDQQGNSSQMVFHVTVGPDVLNSGPFLSEIGPIRGIAGQNIPINLAPFARDVEGNSFFFDAVKPNGENVAYTLSTDNNSGVVTVTPPVGFIGTFNVLVGVRGAVAATTVDQFDTQIVSVTVAPPAPTGVDLLSDSGFSPTDNITNTTSLSFQVTGVTAGASVKLMEGNTVLASGIVAAGNTTINLNVTAGQDFGEGLHTLRATQTINGIESDLTTPANSLNMELDTTPPGAFDTTAPSEATVGVNLNYDADVLPGEGTAGFTYSLQSAPAGANINSSSGILTWIPASNQVGNHVFGIVATDAAGNINTQTVSLNVAQPIVPTINITFTLTKPDGSPLTTLGVNQDFVLHAFVQDVRPSATGVFTIGFDVAYAAARAQATGNITFTSQFGSIPNGTSSPGLLDEIAATNSTILNAVINSLPIPDQTGKLEVFSIPMKAVQAGQLTFTADPHEGTTAFPIAFYPSGAPGAGEVSYGSVSILVAATFQAADDNFNVNEDSGATKLTPLANDTINPGSGNILTVTGLGATNQTSIVTASGGTATITDAGTRVTYTPANNFNGTDTFTYTVSNQNNESITRQITVGVQPVNDVPDAVNDGSGTPIAVPEDAQNFTIDVLANDTVGVDTDETVSTLRVTAVTQPAHGTVTFTATGVKYTPTGNYTGPDSFTYTISDRATGGLTDTATVTVNVTEVNDNPTANNDTATVGEESGATTINVMANDSIAPDTGETITVTAVSNPSSGGGTVAVGTGGANVVYTPANNFQGTDTFTYTITDSRGGTATATVTVTVTNTNDPPTSVTDTVTAFKNTTAKFDVLANDTAAPDPGPEVFTIDSVTQPAHGTVSITDNGTRITYVPTTDYTGPDSFTYIMKDAAGALSQSATVNVTVQAFIPSSLSGFVYFDYSNDGTMGGSETPIAGVTITLTGTDVNNAAVNQTTKTKADGSYTFTNLAPGTYTITQTQPAFTVDGKEKVGGQGGTSSVNDKIVVTLAQNTQGTGNNFGEMGRQLSVTGTNGQPQLLVTLSDFFSSRSRNTSQFAVDSTGTALWHATSGPIWNGFTNTVFSLTTSNTKLQVDAKNASNQNVTASINLTDPRITLLATQGTTKIYKFRGGPGAGLTFTPTGGSGEGEGEGEGAPAAASTPSEQALLGYLAATADEESRAFSRLARPPGTNWQAAVDQALSE